MYVCLRAVVWAYLLLPWMFLQEISLQDLVIVLGAAALEIAQLRFFAARSGFILKTAVFAGVSLYNPSFAALTVLSGLDGGIIGKGILLFSPAILFASGYIGQDLKQAAGLVCFFILTFLSGTCLCKLERLQEKRAADESEGNRLRLELEEVRFKLENVSRNLVGETERNERTRIAQSIHDEVGHRLTGILMQLQASEHLRTRDSERSEMMLRRSIEALGEAIEVLRDTIHNLRPRAVSDASALRSIVSKFRFRPVELTFDDRTFGSLPAEYRDAAIESLREMLTNAARHSGAERITVRVHCSNGLMLQYQDDGSGASTIREGLGLRGIRKLFESLGGSVHISGEKGFRVICKAPLEGGTGEAHSSDDL